MMTRDTWKKSILSCAGQRDPDIHHGRMNADFGWGFYLTPDKDFTYRWAGENAIVNEYELDESGLIIF